MEGYKRLEDLIVYQKLCQLHIAVSEVTHRWPAEERYELASQARRSSNSAPAQLAEKYDDRHVRNKIEGVNRSRGEAAETVHHLYMAYDVRGVPRPIPGVHPDAQRHGTDAGEAVAGVRSPLAPIVRPGGWRRLRRQPPGLS